MTYESMLHTLEDLLREHRYEFGSIQFTESAL